MCGFQNETFISLVPRPSTLCAVRNLDGGGVVHVEGLRIFGVLSSFMYKSSSALIFYLYMFSRMTLFFLYSCAIMLKELASVGVPNLTLEMGDPQFPKHLCCFNHILFISVASVLLLFKEYYQINLFRSPSEFFLDLNSIFIYI